MPGKAVPVVSYHFIDCERFCIVVTTIFLPSHWQTWPKLVLNFGPCIRVVDMLQLAHKGKTEAEYGLNLVQHFQS